MSPGVTVTDRKGRGGGTKTKVGGLTLPLNDCTEAGVQGLHSEEFFFPLASEKVVGLSSPTPQSGGGGANAPSAPPPGSATPGPHSAPPQQLDIMYFQSWRKPPEMPEVCRMPWA